MTNSTQIAAFLTVQFRFLGQHTGAGRFFRLDDGLFFLEISDRWGTYVVPRRYRLDEIDALEKAKTVCTFAAEQECAKDDDDDGNLLQ